MQGYENFGINRRNGVTTYREWAPAAQVWHPVTSGTQILEHEYILDVLSVVCTSMGMLYILSLIHI